MKNINEYTHEEKLKLTDAEVDKMVMLKLAEEGVPLKFQSPEKPDREKIVNKSVQAWSIGGFYFKDKTEAEKLRNVLLNLKRYRKTYDYNISYSYEWLEVAEDDLTIGECEFYTERDVRDNVDAIKNWHSVEEAYEKQKRAWESFRSKYRSVYEEIWNEVKKARKLQERSDDYKKVWNEYLALADNNSSKALQFFFKANSPTDEECKLAGIDRNFGEIQ